MNTVGKTLVFIVLGTFMVGAVAATVIGSTTEADAVTKPVPRAKLCHENFEGQLVGQCASANRP